MPEVPIDVATTKTREADDRGRVRLGPEFADATVTVAVVEVHDDGEQSAETDDSGA